MAARTCGSMLVNSAHPQARNSAQFQKRTEDATTLMVHLPSFGGLYAFVCIAARSRENERHNI
jgi:hypothetical protein